MAEGLVWLALLAVFVGLARAGWIEYRKVEAYRLWAQSFERAKYDIYAVLGQKEQTLTWGTPSLTGPIGLQTCSLDVLDTVLVQVDGQLIDFNNPPRKGKKIQLELQRRDEQSAVFIPFTDVMMAVEWAQYLMNAIKTSPD